ncbi:peptidoglycan DD-metalloendopeptidase family protein [Streptomyces goshikiensis]|uniref:Peptidoglycan DD-metalloendopeptidase family protein n=1 Tax=Streptomyces goshikiensis TaxID=1942 RepID=A0ABZ1RI52_9ACTN|nr:MULTISPECIES: peptidoglycan DD-metalloendopeptidase family protein [Streptomyces]AKL68273.1 peptidase [Streptomyces sp. Mg1]EDX24348.1 peptidase [Streptomyces sp. Mg1]MBP0936753.1 peptidoglycan DD-metalloendopeptidase family protein [Streptomyces sp. KCTC 0041BP]OKI40673.1 peptidase [Streptomyces sp. CB03578]PJN15118.1 peptidase [Streptomyces sp. CB02120-2]
MAFGSRAAGKHRGSSRLSRKTAGYAGIAALATTGVVGSIAAPAFAADGKAPSMEDTGLNAVVVAEDLQGEIQAQADSQERAAEVAATKAQAEADAKQQAAEAKRVAEAKAKAERDAAERAAREEERKRLNTFVAPVEDSYVSTQWHAGGGMWSSGSHTGIDFHAASGTTVHAVGAGTVVESGNGGAYGNNVVIKHNDGTYTQYGHMSSLSVSVGQEVTAGQQIGLSGSTGNSSGPHLHFEARTGPQYGSDIDPVSYLRSHGVNV